MHQLERRAQDDPFFMDALDGFESANHDQQVNLGDIYARLHQRIAQPQRRIIPWRMLSIAASVLIFITAGGLWFYNSRPAGPRQAAQLPAKGVKQTPQVAATDTGEGKNNAAVPAPAPQKYALHLHRTAKADTTINNVNAVLAVEEPRQTAKDTDTTPLNEMVVMGYEAQKKKSTNPGNIIKGTVVGDGNKLPIPGVSVNLAGTNKVAVTGIDGNFTLLVDSNKGKLLVSTPGFQSRILKVYNNGAMGTITLNPNNYSLNDMAPYGDATVKKDASRYVAKADTSGESRIAAPKTEKLLLGKAAGLVFKSYSAPVATINKNQTIRGKVIDKDDGQPIPGAYVKIAGSNKGVVTDVTGTFTLPADSGKKELMITYVGYETRQILINHSDSAGTIKLEANRASLAEVVVVNPNKADDNSIIHAHPRAGWSSFQKYLKENAASPDGKTGAVRLSFDVDSNGNITGMKILKSISPATDQKAIDLITNGPDWAGSTNGQSEKIHVRVKFGK